VRARAILTSQDGTETVLTGATDVPPNGGLVQFLGRPTPLVEDVESIRIVFDQPVEVATSVAEDPDAAIVLWMGQAA
jgi:hypothetical protein